MKYLNLKKLFEIVLENHRKKYALDKQFFVISMIHM